MKVSVYSVIYFFQETDFNISYEFIKLERNKKNINLLWRIIIH